VNERITLDHASLTENQFVWAIAVLHAEAWTQEEFVDAWHGSTLQGAVPTSSKLPSLRVGVAGLGAVGRTLAGRIVEGAVPGAHVAAVAARSADKARAALSEMRIDVPVVSVEELSSLVDVVVECAPATALASIARPVLEQGRKLIVLSSGALLDLPELSDLARVSGGQIVVPTGALLGLDAVAAAAQGTIHSVTMTTRKPIAGLLGAPLVEDRGLDLRALKGPLRLFRGTAREAAKRFPANLNVAVALSLAGIGPDRTILEVWVDPNVNRNCHRIEVESDSARLDMTIENIPSENPRTGRITALSVLACLRKIGAPLQVGT
jgi:aspartate dehydrogenase